ncbi:histidinol-phosphatase (PHP family) [Bacillus sp. cl95]|nr:histidinol-phosphatase (PHP family) [Bacillus sp. UNCCL13]SFQ76777.1 histidinol-phosphatase (PHP family) [Bacillus sp. cl95]
MLMKDGHIHTAFCPHGTKDSLEAYVERALSLGFKEISFTEHAPLPIGFEDPIPSKDNAMAPDQLEPYLEEVARIKEKYKDQIIINRGLEVDFIEGFEKETKEFLNTFGNQLDDAILSVHFLKIGNGHECIDYSPDLFQHIITQLGSIEKLYEKYFATVLQSILSDLGQYKPKRIGHITLVKKFQKKLPCEREFTDEISKILFAMKEGGYELDYNGAGLAKPLCRETYPPEWVVQRAKNLTIPLVYGSDSHQVKDLGQGLNVMRL